MFVNNDKVYFEEQCVKFYVNSVKILQRYFKFFSKHMEDSMSWMQWYKWSTHFKVGITLTDKDPVSGQPSMSIVNNHIKVVYARIVI